MEFEEYLQKYIKEYKVQKFGMSLSPSHKRIAKSFWDESRKGYVKKDELITKIIKILKKWRSCSKGLLSFQRAADEISKLRKND